MKTPLKLSKKGNVKVKRSIKAGLMYRINPSSELKQIPQGVVQITQIGDITDGFPQPWPKYPQSWIIKYYYLSRVDGQQTTKPDTSNEYFFMPIEEFVKHTTDF